MLAILRNSENFLSKYFGFLLLYYWESSKTHLMIEIKGDKIPEFEFNVKLLPKILSIRELLCLVLIAVFDINIDALRYNNVSVSVFI